MSPTSRRQQNFTGLIDARRPDDPLVASCCERARTGDLRLITLSVFRGRSISPSPPNRKRVAVNAVNIDGRSCASELDWPTPPARLDSPPGTPPAPPRRG